MSRVLKSAVKYSVKTLSDRSKVTIGHTHDINKILFELRVKLQYNLLPLTVSLIVWLSGVYYYYLNEPKKEDVHLYKACMIALGIRNPSFTSDISAMYQLCWPIFLETVVFGLLTTALLGNFNPKILSKLHAQHKSGHVVVIGYSHLGMRIVDYLQMKKMPYVVIDEKESEVADLVSSSEPVVIGDAKELSTLKSAQIQSCKEVYVSLENFQSTVVACIHIRALNPKCPIYVETSHDDDFAKYFAEELRVTPFNTSQWAKESVREWTENQVRDEWKEIAIFGSGKLSQNLTEYLAHDKGFTVHVIDQNASDDRFPKELSSPTNHSPKSRKKRDIHLYKIAEPWNVYKYMESIVPFKNISHVFVTWKEREEVIKIAILLKKHHPDIKLFIRIFDEIIGDVVHGLGAHAFSTSQFAFSMLQHFVSKESPIYVPPKDLVIAEEDEFVPLESPMQVRSTMKRKNTISFSPSALSSPPHLMRSKSDFGNSPKSEADENKDTKKDK